MAKSKAKSKTKGPRRKPRDRKAIEANSRTCAQNLARRASAPTAKAYDSALAGARVVLSQRRSLPMSSKTRQAWRWELKTCCRCTPRGARRRSQG